MFLYTRANKYKQEKFEKLQSKLDFAVLSAGKFEKTTEFYLEQY